MTMAGGVVQAALDEVAEQVPKRMGGWQLGVPNKDRQGAAHSCSGLFGVLEQVLQNLGNSAVALL
jgi:hypothetical protein